MSYWNLSTLDQTVCVKDGYIGESIRIVDDILEYTKCNSNCLVSSFQQTFEQAFDSIEHLFSLFLKNFDLDLTLSIRLKPCLLVLRVA